MTTEFKITLAAARVNAGLTQAQLAKLMKKSKSTINNWENGRHSIDNANFMLWCEISGIDPEHVTLPSTSA